MYITAYQAEAWTRYSNMEAKVFKASKVAMSRFRRGIVDKPVYGNLMICGSSFEELRLPNFYLQHRIASCSANAVFCIYHISAVPLQEIGVQTSILPFQQSLGERSR